MDGVRDKKREAGYECAKESVKHRAPRPSAPAAGLVRASLALVLAMTLARVAHAAGWRSAARGTGFTVETAPGPDAGREPLALSAAPRDSSGSRALAADLPPGAPVPAWQRGLLRADRLEHASLSLTIATGLAITGRDRADSFAFTLALGVLKELHDRRHGEFDPVDLSADAVGAALGAWAASKR